MDGRLSSYSKCQSVGLKHYENSVSVFYLANILIVQLLPVNPEISNLAGSRTLSSFFF